MLLPTNDNLKAKISKENTSHCQRLENLKTSLKTAYRPVKETNRRSHQNNKRLYDRKARLRKIELDIIYLYNPAMKPGLSRKLHRP